MLKKIFLSLLFIPIIAAAVYFYLAYREQKTPISDALNAIPSNTSLIIETKQARNTWKKLSETNIMWEDLLATQFFHELNKSGRFIDSLFSGNPEAYPMIENRSVFISAHLSGAKTFDFLYTFSLPELSKESVIRALILGSTMQNQALPSHKYDDGVIEAVKFLLPASGSRTFFYTVHKGIFSGSFSEVLVQDAIRQLNSGTTIISNKDFSRVMNTAGEKVDANVYINYKSFPDILQTFLKPGAKSSMDFLTGFASWSELDVNMKPNALLMNGYTFADDSARNYLGLFSKQKPQQIELTRIIPGNTSTLLFFGLSSFSTFQRNYKNWLDSKGRLFDYNKYVKEINKKYGIQVEHNLLGWIDNEMALAITEPNKKDFKTNCYGVFRSNSILQAAKKLNNLCDTVSHIEKEKSDTENFRGYTIRKFPFPNLHHLLLGDAFANLESNYFTLVEDYIVFGSSTAALRSFINEYGSGRTLAQNSYYNEFTKDNLSAEANIYLYSNIARSTNIYKNYVSDEYEKDIDRYLDLFRKFEAVGMQISQTENGMFYQDIYLRHNPIYKQETTSLWETELDSTVHQQPHLVINHNNQTKEVFVQDDANNIYLISNTGKILWKKKLEEKIMSEVVQVDAKKNKKLQLLFNTASKIYLVDRNGNDVDGFPVKLSSTATGGLAVFDYDNSREYRIFVPTADHNICNYTIEGKDAAKWKYDHTENTVSSPVHYFAISGKDYLAVVDDAGIVYITNRKGEKVLKPKIHLPSHLQNYFIEPGKDLAGTRIICADSSGVITRLVLGGDAESIKLRDFPGAVYFDYKDMNKDGSGEYVMLSGDQLSVFNQDKTLKWTYKFNKQIRQAPLHFDMPGGQGQTGVISTATDEIWLIDENGKPCQGFPFYGSTAFSIGDINKDEHYNVVTAAGKSVYVYSLE